MAIRAFLAQAVIDGAGNPPIYDAVVVTDGDRIVEFGAKSDVRIPDDAEQIDLGSSTIMPGYVDSHSHVSSGGGKHSPAERRATPTESELAYRTAGNLRVDLAHGITTARILGEPGLHDLSARQAIQAGQIVGPDLLVGAYALRPSFGHGFQGTAVDGVENVRAAVRTNLSLGAKHIKAFAGGGISDQWTELEIPYYTFEELQAIADESHRLGYTTTAHAKGGDAARIAVEAGFDCIEHGYTADEALIDLMIKKDAWMSLTPLAVFHEKGCAPSLPNDPISGPKYWHARTSHEKNLPMIVSSGIKYVIGSDGRRGLFGWMFEYLVNAGVEPVRALRAGMLDSAVICRVEDEVGTIAPGKRADLIAVDGDPTKDIKIMRDSRLLAQGGRLAEEVLR